MECDGGNSDCSGRWKHGFQVEKWGGNAGLYLGSAAALSTRNGELTIDFYIPIGLQ